MAVASGLAWVPFACPSSRSGSWTLVHRATCIVCASSVVNRCHGYTHERRVDMVHLRVSGGLWLPTPHRAACTVRLGGGTAFRRSAAAMT